MKKIVRLWLKMWRWKGWWVPSSACVAWFFIASFFAILGYLSSAVFYGFAIYPAFFTLCNAGSVLVDWVEDMVDWADDK